MIGRRPKSIVVVVSLFGAALLLFAKHSRCTRKVVVVAPEKSADCKRAPRVSSSGILATRTDDCQSAAKSSLAALAQSFAAKIVLRTGCRKQHATRVRIVSPMRRKCTVHPVQIAPEGIGIVRLGNRRVHRT